MRQRLPEVIRVNGVNLSLRWMAKRGIPKPSLTVRKHPAVCVWPHGFEKP